MLLVDSRRALRALVMPAAIAVLALTVVATGMAASAQKPAPPEEKPNPVKSDRDGNKVFEDLEARLASLGGGERVSVIVKLRVPATSDRVADLARQHGGFEVARRFSIVDGFSAQLTKGQIEALSHVPWVEHVEENSVVRKLNDSAQSAFGVTKARADAPSLDGDADGNVSAYSKGDLVAAVIDTGVDAKHADLDEGKVIAFKDFVNGRTDAYDDEGHGTHVAATIAGDGDGRADGLHKGVAPGAALVGVKVLDASGSGTMENVTAAIDWVVQNKDLYGIEAINLSLGASGCADGTDITSQAVNNAHAAGLVVAVAAGNEGPGTCTVGSPGAAVDGLTVGAMADTGAGGFSLASFSSRGKTGDGRIKPDLVAPGVGVTSAAANTTNGYATYNGTSMATPFVAGVALLMRDANAALSSADVKVKLTATTLDWGTAGVDGEYGSGRLDAYAALKSAGAALTAGPSVPVHVLREGTLSGTGARAEYTFDVGDTAFPIAATLIHPGVTGATAYTPDFDLYLYDPAGTLVARAETVSRQENVSFKPTTTGKYTLRVYSYSGSGAYYVDVSAGLSVDTTAPTISSVSPADRATGIAGTSNVSVTFSEAMDKAATQAAFSLVGADGTAVSGTFSWNTNTMTFDPGSDLAPGATYTAKVTTAAKDAAGNALASEKVWSFTVATAPVATTAFPSSVHLYYGSVRSGGASQLASDDNAYYEVNSTTSGTRQADWYGLIKGVSNAVKSLKVTYRGKSSASCDQRLYVYNWTNGSWTQVDRRTLGTSEAEVAVALSGTLANYVSGSSGDGDVAVRVRCVRDSGSFYTSGDLMKAVFEK